MKIKLMQTTINSDMNFYNIIVLKSHVIGYEVKVISNDVGLEPIHNVWDTQSEAIENHNNLVDMILQG